MNIGDNVKIIIDCTMKYYPAHISTIIDGDYYICNGWECRWFEAGEFEVENENKS